MASSFIPKSRYRWMLKSQNLEPFLLASAARPSFAAGNPKALDPLSIKIIDSYYDDFNAAEQVELWIDDNQKRDVSITMFDSVGMPIEDWVFHDAHITHVDYGKLSYDLNGPCIITLTLVYKDYTLKVGE